LSGTGKILSVSIAPGSFDATSVSVYGKLSWLSVSAVWRTRSKSRLSDEEFNYVIEAWDDAGHFDSECIFGASGPAIETQLDASSEALAKSSMIESVACRF
jgi:hypothetical protein